VSKDRYTIFRFAASGFAIAVLFVVLQVLVAYSFLPGMALSNLLFATCLILCPPFLLAIPLIDVETGTGGFYILWVVVALLNAGLYAVVGTAYVGIRQKRGGAATS
jgi:hypothetical protein